MGGDFKDSKALFNANLSPSGMFTMNRGSAPIGPSMPPIDHTTRSVGMQIIFNPMPTNANSAIRDQTTLQTQERFLVEYEKSQKIKLFDRSFVDDYSATLFRELVPGLLQANHDLILFPLRGCRQPGILAKVIAGIPEDHMVIFNYTYATRSEQQVRIVSELRQQMIEKLPEKPAISIGVLDTAKGGYGSEHLAKLLAELHGGRTQQWAVQFHLLHARDSTPTLAYKIPKYTSGSLMFLWPLFYEVESLLVEDWSEGIGLSVELEGSTHELKRCSTPGRIILRDDSSIQLIESESVSELMTELIVDAVNRQMLNDPQVQFIHDYLKVDTRG